MINVVILGGRLTADMEVRYTQAGKPVGSFTIACDRPKYGNNEKQTDFISCTMWGDRVQKLAQYLTKGKPVAVTGEIRTRSYEDKDGNRRKVVEVNVNDLRFLPDGKGNSNNQQQQRNNSGNLYDGASEISYNDEDIPF